MCNNNALTEIQYYLFSDCNKVMSNKIHFRIKGQAYGERGNTRFWKCRRMNQFDWRTPKQRRPSLQSIWAMHRGSLIYIWGNTKCVLNISITKCSNNPINSNCLLFVWCKGIFMAPFQWWIFCFAVLRLFDSILSFLSSLLFSLSLPLPPRFNFLFLSLSCCSPLYSSLLPQHFPH